MKYALLLLVVCFQTHITYCQQTRGGLPDSNFRYTDFHIHTTYKHYLRPRTIDEMELLLAHTNYKPEKHTIEFDSTLLKLYRSYPSFNNNWGKYQRTKRKKLRGGKTSDLRSYDQASFAEITGVPGSILCSCIYPFEKQYAVKWLKRVMSGLLVTKMGFRRLKYCSKDVYWPLKDFFAEYYYLLLQDTAHKVVLTHPQTMFAGRRHKDLPGDTFRFENHIRLMHNNAELKAALKYNGRHDRKSIITPLLLTVEGGQALYGPHNASAANIFNPGNCDSPACLSELLRMVDTLKNLPHRLFFIAPGHFTENHVVGYAKTMDREPEHFQHRATKFLANYDWARTILTPKSYQGMNGLHVQGGYKTIDCRNAHNVYVPYAQTAGSEDTLTVGKRVFERLLDTANYHHKPVYIDVKHMDVQGRIEYYYLRRARQQKVRVPIPIIASHVAVSGEGQTLSSMTGLWPHFDEYNEIDFTNEFYRYSSDTAIEQCRFTNMRPETRRLYVPLDFLDTGRLTRRSFVDSFHYRVSDTGWRRTAGWFYPWSMNLFDEEIVEINKSGGIIGLLLDPRQLGGFMDRYNDRGYVYRTVESCVDILRSISSEDLARYGLNKEDERQNYIAYWKCEPLLRNIFHIVKVVKARQAEERMADSLLATGYRSYQLKDIMPGYVHDTAKTRQEPWSFISFGADYDGLIDPIDIAPTSAYIPMLRKNLVLFAWIYARLHQDEFNDTGAPYIPNLKFSEQKMQQLFFTNGERFMLRYF